jgi:hypothetical protein
MIVITIHYLADVLEQTSILFDDGMVTIDGIVPAVLFTNNSDLVLMDYCFDHLFARVFAKD